MAAICVCAYTITTTHPSFHPTIYQAMKIEKVIFHLPFAIDKVSRRYGFDALTDNQLFILYTLNYLPMNTTQGGILRHAFKCNYPISNTSVSRGIGLLVELGLVTLSEGRYSLAPLGRDYLSSLRRFLLNRRL